MCTSAAAPACQRSQQTHGARDKERAPDADDNAHTAHEGHATWTAWLLRTVVLAAGQRLPPYKAVDLDRALHDAAPDGIDIYFDNLGGDHLQAALSAMKPFGRIPLCGMISTYNAATPPPGPNNLMLMVTKRIVMRGFLVGDHADRKAAFRADVGGYVRDGRIRVRETVVDGIAQAPEAFLALLRGEHIGKMVVRVGPDPS